MDGNDLNPVIRDNGTAVYGPDPRPMAEIPGMAEQVANAASAKVSVAPGSAEQMSSTATQMPQVMTPGATMATGTPAMMGATSEAAAKPTMRDTAKATAASIASDIDAAVASEQGVKVQKIIILVVIAICTGFAVLALAIVVLVNIPRISALENQIDSLTAQSQKIQEQIAALGNRIGYDIDVTFFDDMIPGTTYTVTLQPDTQEVAVTTLPGCSLADPSECPTETNVRTTILSASEYSLVKRAYDSVDGSAMNYTRNMLNWVQGILALIEGDTIIADMDSQDWEIIKNYDTNGDNKVSSREYGTSLLSQMAR